MKAAVAITNVQGPRAFEDLRAQLDAQPVGQPCACVLFSTGEHAPYIRQTIEAAKRYAFDSLIAGSTGWIISSADPGRERGSLGMLVIGEERAPLHFGSRILSSVDRFPDWPSDRQIIAIADPRTDMALLQMLMTQTTIAGGGIAGRDGERFVASINDLGEGGCAVLQVPDDGLLVGTASGLTPSGPEFVVTRAKGRRILELDGQPPLPKMLSHFQSIGKLEDEETITAGLFLCDLGYGERVTGRMILSIDRSTGALELDQPIVERSRAAFATRDMVGGQRSMTHMLQDMKARLGLRRPVAGVLFSSFERSDLFLERDFEVKEILRHFPGLPILGMSTTFELVHLQLQFHSCVLALILES